MAVSRSRGSPMSKLFVPMLAGATLRERVIACLGALVGITLTGVVAGLAVGRGWHLPLIIGPLGASAVLLFAVPTSPLAQPWPILGGNTISALVGVAVAHLIPEPTVAAGVAVALAILVMSLTRSLHPPGGAAALTAVIGGPVIAAHGWMFPLVPVALDALLLVLVGLAFHRLAGRSYPHRPPPPFAPPVPGLAATPATFELADVDAALAALHETFDVDRDDVVRLLEEVERQAALRRSR